MNTALQIADELAEMGWGRVRNVVRGRIVMYFSEEQPDRQGRKGYGFIRPIDDKERAIKSAAQVWFHISRGYFVRVAPAGNGLNWTYSHFVLDQQFKEPVNGDTVVFEQRPSRRRKGFETGCWTYESEYLRASAELALHQDADHSLI